MHYTCFVLNGDISSFASSFHMFWLDNLNFQLCILILSHSVSTQIWMLLRVSDFFHSFCLLFGTEN